MFDRCAFDGILHHAVNPDHCQDQSDARKSRQRHEFKLRSKVVLSQLAFHCSGLRDSYTGIDCAHFLADRLQE
jgi:hypothetical protein